jgi:prolipoprotein diacylglyceryltransferase
MVITKEEKFRSGCWRIIIGICFCLFGVTFLSIYLEGYGLERAFSESQFYLRQSISLVLSIVLLTISILLIFWDKIVILYKNRRRKREEKRIPR